MMLIEWYAVLIDIFKNVDDQRPQEIYDALSPFMRKTRDIRKRQIKRIKNHEVGTRNSVLFLNQLGELRNLALFSTRIVRVFDELILNPFEESEFVPSSIKKELKEMRKEAKSEAADIVLEEASEIARDEAIKSETLISDGSNGTDDQVQETDKTDDQEPKSSDSEEKS